MQDSIANLNVIQAAGVNQRVGDANKATVVSMQTQERDGYVTKGKQQGIVHVDGGASTDRSGKHGQPNLSQDESLGLLLLLPTASMSECSQPNGFRGVVCPVG